MKTKRSYAAVLSSAVALAVLVVAGTRVKAQDVPPLAATGQFGLMGAARGEVARLSISNINLVPPDPNCQATLLFVDGAGALLRRPDGTPVRKDVLLAPGQSSFLQFHASALIAGDDNRVNFRPVVLVPRPTVPPDPNAPADPCVASFEVIDNATGQTRLVNPGGARATGFNHNETLVQDR